MKNWKKTSHSIDAVVGTLVCAVRKFVVAVVGDLSAIMHIQNRKAMSPHECILCSKKKSEWSGDELNEKEEKTYSEKIAGRLWPVDEDMFLLPLLHLLIGTANYQILKKLIPYLMTLQPTSVEVELKKEILDLTHDVEEYPCRDVDMNILQCKQAISKKRYDLHLVVGKLERLCKNSKKKTNPMYLSSVGCIQRAVSVHDMKLRESLIDLEKAKNALEKRKK